mgnify:CR=1 FL=1
MASVSPVVQQCFREASDLARKALEASLEHAVAAIQDAESRSTVVFQRNNLAEAWTKLQKQKANWGAQFPVTLLAAFHDAANAPADIRAPAQPAYQSSNFSELSLVDDSQVAKAIESSRLLQVLLPAVEQQLGELDGLMSTALGLPSVQPDRNPMRPQVFADALRSLLSSGTHDSDMSALWIRHLAPSFARELKEIYKTLTARLQSANVQVASYRVLQTPSNLGGGGGGGGGAAASARSAPGANGANGANGGGAPQRSAARGGAGGFNGTAGTGNGQGLRDEGQTGHMPPASYADLSAYEVQDALFQDFLYRSAPHAQQALAPAYYEAIDQELNALQEPDDDGEPVYRAPVAARYRRMAAVDRPLREVGIDSPLNPETWGQYGVARQRSLVRSQLRKEAKQVGQVLGLEVVRKVVGQVAQDPRLLAPVREGIVALEPSLLRLAMVDPRFLSDEQHPGRRLIERVAERSFKYNDEFSSDFAGFFGQVSPVFNLLNDQVSFEDAKPFAFALAQFEEIWKDEDNADQAQRDKAVSAMRLAEQRQSLADQVAWELSTRPDLDKVPGVVMDFLFGPWALVIAHAKLTDPSGHNDAGVFGLVVSDLLWSVKREATLKAPAKLFEMIPRMLATLREGLARVGHEPGETQAFFETLEKLHRPVLKLRRAKSQQDATDSEQAALAPMEDYELPASAEQRKPKARAGADVWLARQEFDDAGFEDTEVTEAGELTPSAGLQTEALSPQLAPDEATGSNMATLEATTDPDNTVPLDPDDELINEFVEAPSEAAQATEPAEVLASLREGSWVDLYSKRRWLRAQLIWASTKGTLFMFTSQGGQPHSMTRRSCERLIRDRLLRPVETQGVVRQAIEQLAQQPEPRARGATVRSSQPAGLSIH